MFCPRALKQGHNTNLQLAEQLQHPENISIVCLQQQCLFPFTLILFQLHTQLGRNQPQFCLFKARIKFPPAAILCQNIKGKTNKFWKIWDLQRPRKLQAVQISHLEKCPCPKFTISASNSKLYWWGTEPSQIKCNRMGIRGVYQLQKASVNKFRVTLPLQFPCTLLSEVFTSTSHVKHSFSPNLLCIPPHFHLLSETLVPIKSKLSVCTLALSHQC